MSAEPTDGLERGHDPLPPHLPHVAINQPLPVHDGTVVVTDGSARWDGLATTEIRWTPQPALICRIDLAPSEALDSLFRWEAGRDLSIDIDGSVVKGRMRRGSWRPDSPWIELRIYDAAAVGNREATEFRFELVNMEDVYGAPVRYDEFGWGADRLILASDRWKVELDAVQGLGKVQEDLRAEGGYAVTHIGRAIPRTGGTIDFSAAEALFTTLQYTFSFAERRWITPVRGQGLAADGRVAWALWGLWNTDPWSTPPTWFSHRSDAGLAEVFKSIDDRWPDQYWERLLRTSMHYYLEVTSGLVNRQLIMGASLLELIGWHLVVETQGLLSPNGYDRLESGDRIRLLMGLMQIPTAIPPEMVALRRYARPAWDAPQVLAEIRHSVVHAKRHKSAWEIDDDAWNDISKLNGQLCELAMLFMLDYIGEYVDPVTARHAADARTVPWRRN